MARLSTLIVIIGLVISNSSDLFAQKVFDVHIHGDKDVAKQMNLLEAAGVYKAALSTSWDQQKDYPGKTNMKLLSGLMLPCPNGKVPYSLQPCYSDGKHFPDIKWVEQQIKEKRIDFIGEVLSQYYGISASDKLLYPYYALAEKYKLPVGIHTGLAGPDHGSPDFKVALGNPILLENLLVNFPKLRVWIMHSGTPFLQETMAIMSVYRNVYADISAISNSYIVPPPQFRSIIKTFIDAGMEDRLMFGSDNGDINQAISAVKSLDFLSAGQKEKIFYRNAEKFFLQEGN